MKMLKKGFIALTVLGAGLFFAAFGLGVVTQGSSELAVSLLLLGPLAIVSGTAGTVITICYEKWVEYRTGPVKSASQRRNAAVQSVFAAVTVLGVFTLLLHFGLGLLGLPPVWIFGVRGMGGIGALLLAFLIFSIGAVGFFFTWVLGFVYDKRAGKE